MFDLLPQFRITYKYPFSRLHSEALTPLYEVPHQFQIIKILQRKLVERSIPLLLMKDSSNKCCNFYNKLTFKMLWAADKLDAGEEGNSTRQEHGEASHLHVALLARCRSSLVPSWEGPATGRVVNVIEQTSFRHQQSIRLEWSFCNKSKKRNIVIHLLSFLNT